MQSRSEADCRPLAIGSADAIRRARGVAGLPYGWIADPHQLAALRPRPLWLWPRAGAAICARRSFLGYVYQRTHRIVPCIVCHALFNLFTMFDSVAMVFPAVVSTIDLFADSDDQLKRTRAASLCRCGLRRARQNAIVGERQGAAHRRDGCAGKGQSKSSDYRLAERTLGVSKSAIELISGETSPQKRFLIVGADADEIRKAAGGEQLHSRS